MSEQPTGNRLITPTVGERAGEDLLATAHDALGVICLDPSIRRWLAGSDPEALAQADTARVKLRDALAPPGAERHAPADIAAGDELTASDTATVRFIPQAWIDDHAVRVDPAGPTTFEVPAQDAKNPDGVWLPDHDDRSDVLRDHENAPAWIRGWSGPFEIEIAHTHTITDGEGIDGE